VCSSDLKTKNRYNFYIPIFFDYINNKLYNYIDQVFKIENSSQLFKNIKFIKYYYPFDSIKLTNFINYFDYHLKQFGFYYKEINKLIFDLKTIVNDCNLLLNIDYKSLIDKVKENTWTREIWAEETLAIKGVVWYKNFRLQALFLVIACLCMYAWFY
jgi:hypothetical protein